MPPYFFKDAPLSDEVLAVASALNRAFYRHHGPESRVQWNDIVLVVANTLFERNDWSNEMTHSMKQFTNFLDLCRENTSS